MKSLRSNMVTLLFLTACLADADGDGLSNRDEAAFGTDPKRADTDGDGLDDGLEVSLRTDPLLPDTDQDGLTDREELDLGLDPRSPDTDGDGLYDQAERLLQTDPTRRDTDRDGLLDGEELELGTTPTVADSDEDGVSDGDELTEGTDPLAADTDADALRDGDELALGTDPLRPDTDGDGFSDGVEVAADVDPLDPWLWDFYGLQWPDRSDEARPVGAPAWRVGATVPDTELIDQVGMPVHLHRFAGYVVRIDVLRYGDERAREIAEDARLDWATHRERGYLVLQVVMPPIPAVADHNRGWALEEALDFPVLDGAGSGVLEALVAEGLTDGDEAVTLLLDRRLAVRNAWRDGPGPGFASTRDALLALP